MVFRPNMRKMPMRVAKTDVSGSIVSGPKYENRIKDMDQTPPHRCLRQRGIRGETG
jgi:hypothetical protein